ncbi:MAG: spermidine/putrescine ABC transporter substrate-binding protein [Eubacteriales bacterium]|nr:spermidine/putrescine ABC transporter substrate-binding protein [Eubacteriales bacterium]
MRISKFKVCVSLLLSALMLFSLTACAGNKKEEINLMTWADFIPREIISQFEEETGIKVNYKDVTSNEDMQELLTASPDQYDLAVVTDYMVEILRQNGNIGKLDKDKLPNFGNINPAFQSKYYDANNEYSIPYAVSTAFLLVNQKAVSELGADPIKSYADLWQEELKNNIVVIDWSVEIMGLVLKTLGYEYNETDPAKVAQARDKLLALRHNIVRFETNTPEDSLISGEAVAGFMYSNQALKGIAASNDLEAVFPAEGFPMYIDSFVMSAQSPNPEATYKFLNYVMSGEVSARISEITKFTNTNSKSAEFLSEDFLGNPILNMSAEVASRASFYINVDAVLDKYSQIYDEFKLK